MNPLSALFRRRARADRFSVAPGAARKDSLIYYEMNGATRRAHRSWYRGEHTNFHPVRKSFEEPGAFERYVGHGWMPPEPFIDRKTYITAFGSCFASEVTRFLDREGYNVFGRDLRLNSHVVRSGEGIVNTSAMRQQFEWALAGAVPSAGIWHDTSGEELAVSEEVQSTTRDIFLRTEVFILTLGLSEVWYDKSTGESFWKAIPNESFDESRHGFRVLGVDENRANLERVYTLIREYRSDATVIVTLSPVPLAATFRPVSCITANSVSKASLRVAIDELMRAHSEDPRLFYFPSYEMVSTVLEDAFEDDMRHPTPEAVATIMQAFKRNFLV